MIDLPQFFKDDGTEFSQTFSLNICLWNLSIFAKETTFPVHRSKQPYYTTLVLPDFPASKWRCINIHGSLRILSKLQIKYKEIFFLFYFFILQKPTSFSLSDFSRWILRLVASLLLTLPWIILY